MGVRRRVLWHLCLPVLCLAASKGKNTFQVTVKSSGSLGIKLSNDLIVRGFAQGPAPDFAPFEPEASGLVQTGDRLTAVNGVDVTSQEALFKQFKQLANGATVTFTLAAALEEARAAPAPAEPG